MRILVLAITRDLRYVNILKTGRKIVEDRINRVFSRVDNGTRLLEEAI